MNSQDIILQVISDFNKSNNNQVNLASIGAQSQLAKLIHEALLEIDHITTVAHTVNEQNTHYYKIVHEDV